MAAIIEFPTEATIWRRRTAERKAFDRQSTAKILVFNGIRYSRRQERQKSAKTVGKKGNDG